MDVPKLAIRGFVHFSNAILDPWFLWYLHSSKWLLGCRPSRRNLSWRTHQPHQWVGFFFISCYLHQNVFVVVVVASEIAICCSADSSSARRCRICSETPWVRGRGKFRSGWDYWLLEYWKCLESFLHLVCLGSGYSSPRRPDSRVVRKVLP